MRRSSRCAGCAPARACLAVAAVAILALESYNGIVSEMSIEKLASYAAFASSKGADDPWPPNSPAESFASRSDLPTADIDTTSHPLVAPSLDTTATPAVVVQAASELAASTLEATTTGVAGPMFTKITGGEGGCPAGYALVTDPDACRSAADFLGTAYVGALQAESEPGGCVFRVPDRDVFLNLQQTDQADVTREQICSASSSAPPFVPVRAQTSTPAPPAPDASVADPPAPELPPLPEGGIEDQSKGQTYSMSAKGSSVCADGIFLIADPDRCKRAARKFGRKFIGMLASTGEPFGCLHRIADRDFMFNRLNTKSQHGDRQVVCSTEKGPQPIQREPLSNRDALRLKVFCFGWTARTDREEALLPYARKLFSACDGYAFFTDRDAPGGDEGVVRVEVPATQQKRTESFWLLLKNMVGLMPSWKYLLDNNVVDGYDWVVNLELDHFFLAPLVRRTIADYVNLMIESTLPGQDPWSDPVMMVWGNAFLFNAKLVRNMRLEWDTIGQVITDTKSVGMGCPVISGKRAHNEGHCEQDMVYENLKWYMKKGVTIVGANGCGNVALSDSLKSFPLGCWQDFPFGDSDEARTRAIREVALMQNIPDAKSATKHCVTRGGSSSWDVKKHCQSLFRAKNVPIIHNMKTPAVHEVARDILMPAISKVLSSD